MLRFVAGPDRMLLPDFEARLPGRGMWLSADDNVIETARVTGRLGRAAARVAGGPVGIPDDLLVRLREGVARRIVRLLSLARRAGQVTAGPEADEAWHAAGHSGPGPCVDATGRSAASRPYLLRVPAEVLARVFGAGAAGPVVVQPGRLASALRCEVRRLAGLGLDWSKLGQGERVHDGRQ